ncbi:DUF5994 family protein [Streptacidiphilus neutrinimicus]|uniref:DUF5994 family protein n=1 Tax=Streptacidiphilus neutrinimicus TaxID=105420 RepID=UPI0005A5FDEA|nr:DUF5994 family protein [Streptacidiphilus neutrinimicus]
MSVSPVRAPSVALPPPRTEAESPSLRLALRPAAAAGGLPVGALDGAWWPRSDDLLRELPSLVAALDREWGRITRVAVNPTHWQPLPREVQATGHVVKVGWFTTEQDPHKLLLLSYRTGRWDLLVIPPHTSPESAARLMAAAADPGGAASASALITAEESYHRDTETSPREAGAEAAWESEGGAAPAPPLTMPLGRVHVSEER